MNSTFDAGSQSPSGTGPGAVGISDWPGRLEAAVQMERVFWTPPGAFRVDSSLLLPANPTESVAHLEALLGVAGRCELTLPESAREQAGLGSGGGVLRQLRRLLPGGLGNSPTLTANGSPFSGAIESRARDLFLGFPYLWVPPGFSADGQSPPVLLPLARLPVDVGFDPVAGTITLSVRVTGLGCPLQANPVFFRWLELLTQQPLKDAQNEAPDDPWRRLEWLVELAESSLEIQGLPHAIVPFQDFPSVEYLPFAPAVLSVGALGRFPAAAPLWQTELRELLPRHEVPVGPARWFIGQDFPSTSSLIPSTVLVPVPAPSCEQLARGPENPLLAKMVEQTRELELSLVYAPANAASIETAATLVADGLARDQRVLVLISPPNAETFRGALAARGLEFCGGYAVESSLGGSALRREMLTRYAEPPQRPPDSGTPEFFDVSAQEARWQQLHTEIATAARALHVSEPNEPSFSQWMGEWLELYSIVPPELDEPTETPTIAELAVHQDTLLALLRDAQQNRYSHSLWREVLADPTESNLARSVAEWEAVFARFLPMAVGADTASGSGILPFSSDVALSEQAAARHALAEKLAPLVGWDRPHFCARVATAIPAELDALIRQRETLVDSAQELQGHRLEPDLWARLRGEVPALGLVVAELRNLDAAPVKSWPWQRRRTQGFLLRQLGLKATGPDRDRARIFLRGLSHRLHLEQMVNAWLHSGKSEGIDDVRLQQDWVGTGNVLALAKYLETLPGFLLRKPALDAIQDPKRLADFIASLRRSADSVRSGAEFEADVAETGLFLPEVFQGWRDDWNRGEARVPRATDWQNQHQYLPAALAFHRALAALPSRLQPLIHWHAGRGTAPEVSLLAVRRAVVGAELSRRREQSPGLRGTSGPALQAAFTELSQLVRRRRRQLYRQSLRRRANTLSQSAVAAVAPTPEELLSGRALIALRPLWLTTPTQALELFAPTPLFNLLVVLPTPGESLAEILPTLLRAARAIVVAPPSPVSSMGPNDSDEDGPELLEVVRKLGVPVIYLGSNETPDQTSTAGPTVWPPPHPPAPTSRVHALGDSSRPARTAAAIGALLRNQFDLSTEVQWPDPAGVVDLALRHPADDPSHRAGWLVDLPDWTLLSAPEVGAEAYQVTALITASWQLARIWTPDLLPDPVPILTKLLDEAGIAVRSRAPQ